MLYNTLFRPIIQQQDNNLADGDILEALILLEKEGKAKKPGNSYSTEYDRSEEKNKKEGDKSEKGKHKGKACGFIEKTKELFRKSITNYLVIKSKEDTKAKIPILAAIVIMIFAWHISVIAIIVSLFFGCRYSFGGEEIILGTGMTENGRPYFRVQDSGIGMKKRDVKHMFDRFYRSDEARSYEGTGL